MSVAKVLATCPFCKEPIAGGATKCKHCQSDLSSLQKKKGSLFDRFDNFRFGFLTGVLFSISLAILLYMQCSHE